MTPNISRSSGRGNPLGATLQPGGANFSVYSKHATAMELLLFESADAPEPSQSIQLDPRTNKSYHYWHIFVHGLKAGQVYAYRANGPFEPSQGLRFDPEKILLDPYGRALALPKAYDRDAAFEQGPNTHSAMKSVIADLSLYDWEGDRPLERSFAQTLIYEMHVKGFTQHPNSGVTAKKRGTYAGLIEKIPYLLDLGVTAVELLPIFHFDEKDAPLGRANYWGYCPVSFFAPHAAYSIDRDPLQALDEFRDMVKALHRAGIEVILDVVYNHTAEGDEKGPTFCFRGLGNETYYIPGETPAQYANYSGTGNTLNGNQPIVRRMILDSLRYWVQEMHIDGFRFDLASILSRGEAGRPLANPPVLWDIESDPVLAGTKLIAEAWDAGGLYQVGSFVGDSWKEWNGQFRDDVRRFMRGDKGMARHLAQRLTGSPDMYEHERREAEQSVNFITCHDGFTLNDLVSYNQKHNKANGENNRDGSNDNHSWNCGQEGPTDNPEIENLRNRQAKNFLALNFLSLGAPMLLMGDEVRRTQGGNNNAYCQNSKTSWFDWDLLEKHSDVHRFVKMLAAQRLHMKSGARDNDLTLSELLRRAQIKFHGIRDGKPDWGENSHSLALTAQNAAASIRFRFLVNAYWKPLTFEPSRIEKGKTLPWQRWIDTSLDSPQDIRQWHEAPLIGNGSYTAQPRSVVALFAPIPT